MKIILTKIKNFFINLYKYRFEAVKSYYRKIRFDLNKIKKNPKIFIIGANKTGTTTIRELFREMNFNVAPQQDQENYFDEIIRKKHNFNQDQFDEKVKLYIDKYQVFQDQPFSIKNFYREIYKLYPNSFYIHLNREPNEWYKSLYKNLLRYTNTKDLKDLDLKKLKDNDYIRKGYLFDTVMNYFPENTSLEEANEKLKMKSFMILNFEKRNNKIREFFKNSKKFIEINVKDEKDNSKIVKLLNLKKNVLMPMPHKNKTIIISEV